MTAFTYERDLDHPVSAEVEQTIRSVLEEHLTSQGLEDVQVNPGLDHDGDPVLFVHAKFRRVCQRSDGLHADVRIISIVSPPSPPGRWLRSARNEQRPRPNCGQALAGCS